MLLGSVILLFLPESPKYLLSKHLDVEARSSLTTIAKVNGVQAPPRSTGSQKLAISGRGADHESDQEEVDETSKLIKASSEDN